MLDRDRSAEMDAAYAAAYSEHPLDEADEWGDLESFHRAARNARNAEDTR